MLLALILAATPPALETIAPGIEYVKTADALHIVRIDPAVATLRVGLATIEKPDQPRTAAQWAEAMKFSVVINAGMFKLEDYVSNVGHLHSGTHVNQKAWNYYKTALAFSKGKATMIDLDDAKAKDSLGGYETVVQDLRLIRGNGVNVWKNNGRKWSEAAIAADDKGRILFFFSRAPMMMSEFNAKMLGLGLGVQRMMHAEGGPEASLSIRTEKVKLDLCGSYETGFREDDFNIQQWPIPNVIGVSVP
ncbi:MAG: phosphodiester glycosidase family protein [Archangium sp.]